MVEITSISIFKKEETIEKFKGLLGSRTTAFLTSVMSLIANNEWLQLADPQSVYMSAMIAATLDLPINQNLGFAYILPYKNKDGSQKAQFQMGYKGFIQLALRSGQFKTIAASPVYQGQLIEENPLTWYIFDRKNKQSDEIMGYAAYFSLLNGFEKTLYMSKSELESHGKKFSQTYKRWFGLWKDDFDSMAQKTVLKLLISKYAPLSVDMQKAIISDQGVIKDADALEVDHVDNDQEVINGIDLQDKLGEMKPLLPNSAEWTTSKETEGTSQNPN